jgi:hypothetical protein
MFQYYFKDGTVATIYNKLCGAPFLTVEQAHRTLLENYPGFQLINGGRDGTKARAHYYNPTTDIYLRIYRLSDSQHRDYMNLN